MRAVLSFILAITICSGYAQNLKSGGKLDPIQANMDIRHYTISLNVDPSTQSIDGYTETKLNLAEPADQLLFDLTQVLQVKKIWVDGKEQKFEHSDHRILITGNSPFKAGSHKVKIAYGGKPAIAERAPWVGGFQWEKDSRGNDWIAISCQGEGAKIYFPCKDHPSDEPNEGADLFITVPKGLTVAGPGLLKKTTHAKNKSTFHWKTNYTISNYCILFNVGKYKLVTRDYTTVDGNKVPMHFYVLEENEAKAAHHLELLETSCRVLEKYFGEYPWAKEKIGIAETPHLGMEHQTMNAYGNKFRYAKLGGKDFDWLMHHEFGHEWWANKVTNTDWAHMWIQEGICTYGDALIVRDLDGEEAYQKRMQQTARNASNKLPIVQGDEIDSDQTYHGDIYGKGAFFMHTLRFVMGDEIFFPTLKKLATDPQYTYDNTVVTSDVEKLFSSAYGKSLQPLFKLFLYTTDKLEVGVKQTGDDAYVVKLNNLDMAIPLEVQTDSGVQRITVDNKGVTVKSKSLILIDPKVFYLKKVIYE